MEVIFTGNLYVVAIYLRPVEDYYMETSFRKMFGADPGPRRKVFHKDIK